MKDKKNKETYCNFDYMMKHNCRGCKLGRKCEEYEHRSKRDSSNSNNNHSDNSCKQK